MKNQFQGPPYPSNQPYFERKMGYFQIYSRKAYQRVPNLCVNIQQSGRNATKVESNGKDSDDKPWDDESLELFSVYTTI